MIPQIAIDPNDANVSALEKHDPRLYVYATGTDIKTGESMVAYIVDGCWIRDNVWMDFVEGGNSQRYGFVKDGDFWIEMSDAGEAQFILVHETTEYYAMRDDGMSYDDAHSYRANPVEFSVRSGKKDAKEVLKSLGWQIFY